MKSATARVFSWRHWPLAVKLTSLITTVVVIVVLLLTLLTIQRERQTFRAELEQQAELLLNTLAAGSADSLYFLDADFLSDLMRDMGEFGVVTFGRIYDEDGRVVADARNPDARFSIDPDPFGQQLIDSPDTVFRWEADQLIAGKAVRLGNQTVGAISVGLPTAPLAGKIAAVRDRGIVLAVFAMSTGLILALLVSRSITGPIQAMITATQQVRAGDLSQRVMVENGDELATLAHDFNQMTAQLQQTLNQMQAEIEQRKQTQIELQIAKEAAESANRAKSTFLANMSHELRTPLNAILGFAQLLDRDPQTPPQTRENLRVISRSAEHLLGLINQVLDMSQIEAGRMALHPRDFDLYRLLDDLEGMFTLQAEEKQLRLVFARTPSTPRYIHADEMKLRQMLINLLNNALKFTREGRVMLRVEAEARKTADHATHDLRFTVEDTGPGLATEELEAIFDPFVRARAGQAAGVGTGLGLALSRQFAQMMGGDMTAENVQGKPGQGAIFRFSIRTTAIDAAQMPPSEPERRAVGLAAGEPRYRVLVVDDDETNRKLLFQLLQPMGFAVRQACDGREAVAEAMRWSPHLIWMDVHLPDIVGDEAARRIRTGQIEPAPVIVATTATAFRRAGEEWDTAVYDDLVRKPVQTDRILTVLAQHLGVRYRYESSDEEDEDTLDRAEAKIALAAISPALRRRLRAAARQTNMTAIDAAIAEVGQIHTGLGAYLASLADQFEYDKILTMLDTVEDIDE